MFPRRAYARRSLGYYDVPVQWEQVEQLVFRRERGYLLMDRKPLEKISSEEIDKLRRLLEKAVARICPAWLADEREDLVQSACMRLLEMGRRGGPSEFSAAYLRRVAYSHLVDEIRRRRRRSEVALETEESGSQVETRQAGPERRSMASQLGKAIQDCLERLISPRKQALTLRLQGHGNQEIATLMGWNAKRAENLVTRARADMRQCLEKKGFSA